MVVGDNYSSWPFELSTALKSIGEARLMVLLLTFASLGHRGCLESVVTLSRSSSTESVDQKGTKSVCMLRFILCKLLPYNGHLYLSF